MGKNVPWFDPSIRLSSLNADEREIKMATAKPPSQMFDAEPSKIQQLSKRLYRPVFRRFSTYVLGMVVLAYPFERAFNLGTERFYRNWNKGKLFDEIKGQFKPAEEDEE